MSDITVTFGGQSIGITLTDVAAAQASSAAATASAAAAAASAASVAASVTAIQIVGDLTVTNTTASHTRGQPDLSTPGTLAGVGGTAIVSDADPLDAECDTLRVTLIAAIAGTVYVYTHTRAGDDMTMVGSIALDCDAGDNDFLIDSVHLPMPINSYLGFSGRFVAQTMTGGVNMPMYSGGSPSAPDYTDATTVAAPHYAVKFIAMTGRSRAAMLEEKIGNTVPVGAPVTVGTIDFTVPTAPATTNRFRVINRPFPFGGYIESVDVYMDTAGSPSAYTYTTDGANNWTPYASKGLSVGADGLPLVLGLNSGVPVGIEIPPGGYPGEFIDGISSQAGQWPEGIYFGTTPSFNAALSTAGSKQLLGWNVVEFTAGGIGLLRAMLASDADGTASTLAPSSARPSRIAPEYLETTILYFPGMGQSLWVGSPSAEADTQVTKRQEFGSLTFNSESGHTTLVAATPLNVTDDAEGREFPGFGLNNYARRRIMGEGGPSNIDGNCPIIVGHSANGGQAIAQFAQGATYYVRALDQLAAVETYAGANPLTVGGMMYYQGHQDATLATTRATYKAAMIAIGTNLNADIKAAIPDGVDRWTYIAQVCTTRGTEGADGWEIAMAQFEAAKDGAYVSLAFPDYAVAAGGNGFEDDLHTDPIGTRRAGALFGRAGLTGRKFEPLWCVESYADGTAIKLVYNRDDLALDTDLIGQQINYGFRVFSAVPAEVTSFAVSVDGDTVTLEIGAATAGYSWSYGDLSAVGIAPFIGGAGNLRDSAGDTDVFDDWAMHNWAVLQEGDL